MKSKQQGGVWGEGTGRGGGEMLSRGPPSQGLNYPQGTSCKAEKAISRLLYSDCRGGEASLMVPIMNKRGSLWEQKGQAEREVAQGTTLIARTAPRATGGPIEKLPHPENNPASTSGAYKVHPTSEFRNFYLRSRRT